MSPVMIVASTLGVWLFSLPGVEAPTLLLHSKYHMLYRTDLSKYLAEHIRGARYVKPRLLRLM